MRINNLFGQI